jgi:hypothetical protein
MLVNQFILGLKRKKSLQPTLSQRTCQNKTAKQFMDVAGSIDRSTIIVKNIYTSCSSRQMLAVMSPVVKIDAQTLQGRVLDCYAEYKIGLKYN